MKKKKHIVSKIILSVLLVLLIACGAFAAVNHELVGGAFHLLKTAPGNNVKAAWIFLTGSSDTIQKQISENDAAYSDAVKKVAEDLGGTGLDLSQYTLDMLASGEYSEEEMVRILMGLNVADAENTTENAESQDTERADATVPNVPSEGKNDNSFSETKDDGKSNSSPAAENTQGTSTPSKTETNVNRGTESAAEQNSGTNSSVDTASEEVAKCIAKLYVIKSRFTGQLSTLEDTMKNTYEDLPEEQQVPESRKSIGRQYISQIADMEIACDAEVEAALSELTDTLVSQGKDTAVVGTLREAYENEKSLKKAYYLDVYMNGL